MKLRLLAFGIAKDILQSKSIVFELLEGNTVLSLKSALVARFPEFEKLTAISFAVNEAYVRDDFVLKDDDEVVLIPPVSGG